ncbi:MAG: hypothetical protein JST12_16760 [Armatimonadetes bacterium]|nr:hypothetical protein [Armatimonadota bacterium]MBS1703317.1 hypothetical protein [Armatimonadota bacterium]MBS1729083.1 hypothetical protein [Armatimonadota bacterium]
MNRGILAIGALVGMSMIATAFVNSGLEKGEMVTPFHPKHVAGALKGTDSCFPCTYQNRPQVQAWVTNGDQKSIMAFAKTLDSAMDKYADKEFKAMVVIFTTKDGGKMIEDKSPELNREFKHVSISYLTADNPAVKNYKINTSAKNTVFVYKNWKVEDKFVDLGTDAKSLSALNGAIDDLVK